VRRGRVRRLRAIGQSVQMLEGLEGAINLHTICVKWQLCNNGLLWSGFVASCSAIHVPSVEDTRPELSENVVGLMDWSALKWMTRKVETLKRSRKKETRQK
jgi:hypothetical protein